MKVQKSSRHSKITGDFAEHLILYWLSKYGFESAKVDHNGIDLIARNPVSDELMGISVKCRSRTEEKAGDYMTIPNDNVTKIEKACKAFNCVPYWAIVIDERETICVFILSMKKMLEYFPMGSNAIGWKMNQSWIDKYNADEDIIKIDFNYKTKNWWGDYSIK